MSTVEVTVKSQKGKCAFGHKKGDKIVFDGKSVKGNICYSALMVLLPKIYALRYGIEFPALVGSMKELNPYTTRRLLI